MKGKYDNYGKLPDYDLLNIREVSDYFRHDPRTTYNWIRFGKLVPLRLPNGRICFTKEYILRISQPDNE